MSTNDPAIRLGAPPGAVLSPAPIRLLLCDGSALVRTAVAKLLVGNPHITLIDCARNLREAFEKTASLHPDVVAIDVESPTFGGAKSVEELRRIGDSPDRQPPEVLACCRDSSAAAHTGLRALHEGASDVLLLNADRLSTDPRGAIDDLVRATIDAAANSPDAPSDDSSFRITMPARAPRNASIIAVASGAGGPVALEHILSHLPPSLPCPIVVSQTFAPCFTRALAERLDDACAVSVIHGDSGMPLHPGSVYIVPGDRVGRVRSLGPGPARLDLSTSCEGIPADALFSSCARHWRAGCIALVLSGSHDDGVIGGREVRSAGGLLIAHRPADASRSAMPRAAIRAGASPMTLDQIAAHFGSLGASLARAA